MQMQVEAQTTEMFKRIIVKLRPPENITVSEWADKYRKLPGESAAEQGQWRTSKTPYMKKIMDVVNDDNVRKVVVMSSAQVGKSEFLINVFGFYTHIDPSPMLMVQPTVDLGGSFSKERISPSIRDTPVLREIIGTEKSRDSKNTIMKKYFPGGYIAIVGANSPAGLASRPIKVVLGDETDRWPDSVKREGDPLTLVEKRTTTYPNLHKLIYVSTPTLDGLSRIQHEFYQGTMEEWELPCPSCGEFQTLEWEDIKFTYDKDIGELKEDTDIMCACKHCGELNNERAWKSGYGRWKATKTNKTVKSFHLSALISPWRTWKAIVEEFLKARHDIEKLKAWKNTELGIPWVSDGESINPQHLIEQQEFYDAEVPNDVIILTAAVDVQDDRFELEVVGWSHYFRSWGIEYKVIYGNTVKPETWDRLDQALMKTYTCEDGTVLPITRVCIDSGGHRTSEVYKFCRARESRGIFAIKGKGGALSIVHSHSRTKKEKCLLFTIGVDTAKGRLFSWLSLKNKEEAGYCHFPVNDGRNYDEKYFKGLTSEVKITRMEKGRPKTEWKLKSGQRNEPLDLRVYNIAAIEILNPNFKQLEEMKGKPPVHRKKRRNSKGVRLNE